ncbi:MAG: flavodoxin domain-containing protein [Betaproteobacteria bacterium]
MITILVGSMTGNAEFAAEEMQQVLQELGEQVEIVLMDESHGAEVFRREGVTIVCTSTYGDGEVPENAKPLYGRLCEARPDLAGVRYAVFGLGDSNYETFNFGGQRFDEILYSLGAERLGERSKHDAQGEVTAWELAREWARKWYREHLRR